MATLGFNEYVKEAFVIKQLHELKRELKEINRSLSDLWNAVSDLKDELDALGENYSKHTGEY